MFSDLDRAVRAQLRTLTKENAETVGRHLVMVARLLDDRPELAFEHAAAAVRRAGRIDVVREAAGIAAYRNGLYAEALRELRTVRRLNGSSEHLALMADCERGLGRPERALDLAASPEAEGLSQEARLELTLVVAGARADLGEVDAALAALDVAAGLTSAPGDDVRVSLARADVLDTFGRESEATALRSTFTAAQVARADGTEDTSEVVVYDLADDPDMAGEDGGSGEPLEPASDEPGDMTGDMTRDMTDDESAAAADGDVAEAASRTNPEDEA